MISIHLIVPLLVACVVAEVATVTHRRLRPMIAAPMLTATIAGVSFVAAPTMFVIALDYLVQQPILGDGLEWCRNALGVDHPALHVHIPTWLGLPAVALVVLAVVRTRFVLGSWRGYRRRCAGVPEVIESTALFAYTLPGPGGQIVLSSALIGELTPEELAVVLAHEGAHARHRHDRHVLVADLANAVLPFVRPLQRRLVFVLERWADETAVVRMGGDRLMVARTLARVALSHADAPAPAVAFGGLGVAARVDALLHPPSVKRAPVWTTVMAVGIAAVAIAGAMQVHHVVLLLVSL